MQLIKIFKTSFINGLLVILSVGVVFIISEFVFQKLLFDEKFKKFDTFRNPTMYAAEWDENYHKLIQIWKIGKPKEKPHPQLGWISYMVWPKSLYQPEIGLVGRKTPVLLYGDSFSWHIYDRPRSLPNYFDKDSAFSKDFSLINYACGAYGTDQIYTMFQKTFCRFKKPIVIFSFLTLDLDRSVLSFRDGQKPHYTLNDQEELNIDSSKFIPSNVMYLKLHPPNIKSYLWRKYLYSSFNFFPKKVTQYFTGELANRKTIIELNTKLIQNVITTLRSNKTDFIFLLWEAPLDYELSENENWRVQFIKDLVKKYNIKHVWARDVLPEKLNINDSQQFYKYYIENDGHPTNLYYSYVIDKIKKIVENKEYENLSQDVDTNFYERNVYCHPTYQEQIESEIQKIKNDPVLFNQSIKISKDKNEPLSKAIFDFAIYLMWNTLEN